MLIVLDERYRPSLLRVHRSETDDPERPEYHVWGLLPASIKYPTGNVVNSWKWISILGPFNTSEEAASACRFIKEPTGEESIQ